MSLCTNVPLYTQSKDLCTHIFNVQVMHNTCYPEATLSHPLSSMARLLLLTIVMTICSYYQLHNVNLKAPTRNQVRTPFFTQCFVLLCTCRILLLLQTKKVAPIPAQQDQQYKCTPQSNTSGQYLTKTFKLCSMTKQSTEETEETHLPVKQCKHFSAGSAAQSHCLIFHLSPNHEISQDAHNLCPSHHVTILLVEPYPVILYQPFIAFLKLKNKVNKPGRQCFYQHVNLLKKK